MGQCGTRFTVSQRSVSFPLLLNLSFLPINRVQTLHSQIDVEWIESGTKLSGAITQVQVIKEECFEITYPLGSIRVIPGKRTRWRKQRWEMRFSILCHNLQFGAR